jgi:hypothetical protein
VIGRGLMVGLAREGQVRLGEDRGGSTPGFWNTEIPALAGLKDSVDGWLQDNVKNQTLAGLARGANSLLMPTTYGDALMTAGSVFVPALRLEGLAERSAVQLGERSAARLGAAEMEAGSSNIARLSYVPSSGVQLVATPGKTTTILGSYNNDMRLVVNELGNVKSVDFGPRVGGFNALNVPDSVYAPKTFWSEYNRPWLDKAISRNDTILNGY